MLRFYNNGIYTMPETVSTNAQVITVANRHYHQQWVDDGSDHDGNDVFIHIIAQTSAQWVLSFVFGYYPHLGLVWYKTQMRVIFTQPWLHTSKDPNASNSHVIIDYWRGNARRCVAWCNCRGTVRRHGINGEGPHRVKIVTTPCRLLCHYLLAAQNFLATIWPVIEILLSLVVTISDRGDAIKHL